MQSSNEHRGPGRPAAEGGTDVRAALIAAARARIVATGFAAASAREIAADAGVNAAMISYYFGSKAALGEAVFRETIEPVRAQFAALGDVAAGGADIASFVRAYMRTLADNPWIPRLIVREVLPENGTFRRIFFEEIVGQAAAALRAAVTAEQRRGRLAADADPLFASVSIVSLAVFPFLAAPVLQASFDLDVAGQASFEPFLAHTLGVLTQGLGRGAQGEKRNAP